MYKSYILITLRQLFKHKLNLFINVFGLAISLSVCLFILMYVSYETNFDKFHTKSNQIYRVHSVWPKSGGLNDIWATSTFSYGPVLKENSTDVLDFTRLYLFESERTIRYEAKGVKFREENVFVADANIFTFFNFPLQVGNPNEVLKNPNTVVISEQMAKKIFKNEDPIGKTLNISNRSNTFKCAVTGIFKNLPKNSHLQFEILVSLETIVSVRYKPRNRDIDNDWGHHLSYTYLLLRLGSSVKNVESQFSESVKTVAQQIGFIDDNWAIELQPLEDIHLSPSLALENEKKGNLLAVKGLLAIAFIILIIAWINYINLSTVRIFSRSVEIGIRKVLGERSKDILKLMIIEAFVINIISACLTLFLLTGWIYLLNKLGFYSSFPILTSKLFWIYFTTALCIGILILGILPALFSMRFKPHKLLKGKIGESISGVNLRKVLVITQFSATVVMIITTIIVFKQISFMHQQDLGMKIDELVVINTPGATENRNDKIQSFNSMIRQLPEVSEVSLVSDLPGKKNVTQYGFAREVINNGVGELFDVVRIDYDFIKTFGFTLLAGRDFSKDFGEERTSVVLNETAMRFLNFDNPHEAVGQTINSGVAGQLKIIGIVKDYHYESPKEVFRPIVFHKRRLPYMGYNYICIQVDNKNINNTLKQLEQNWDKMFPNAPFDYFFLRNFFEKQYTGDIQFGKILFLFTGLTIFVTCLGLFGLLLFMTSRRIKEIGIRKVNGAKVSEILTMLNKDFIKWVAIAFVIACPVAWYAMHKWLANFAYKTELSWWIFALAGLFAILIAFLTITIQSWRAATRNPIESLRYE